MYLRNKEEERGTYLDPRLGGKTLEDFYIDQDNGTVPGITFRQLLNELQLLLCFTDFKSTQIFSGDSQIIHIARNFQKRWLELEHNSQSSFADRSFYWARIQAAVQIKVFSQLGGLNEQHRVRLVELFEHASQGFFEKHIREAG